MVLAHLGDAVGVLDAGDVKHEEVNQGDDGKNTVNHQKQGMIHLGGGAQGDETLNAPVNVGIDPKDQKGMDSEIENALEPLSVDELADAHVQPGQHATHNWALAWFHRTGPFFRNFPAGDGGSRREAVTPQRPLFPYQLFIRAICSLIRSTA